MKKPTNSLIDAIIKGIQEKKGSNICVVNLQKEPNAFVDYFVICTGSSVPNVQAIADGIEEMTRTLLSEKPNHIEGYRDANWILMDYFDTLVHIFKEDERQYYNLEDLWANAQIETIPDNQEI